MKDDWSDQTFAERWDAASRVANPVRDEQLDILAAIVADHYKPGDLILDLGCGSGQVDELILTKLPEAHIVGVDASAPMLAMAEQRLAAFGERFRAVQNELSALELTALPVGAYRIVVSSQVLHELDTQRRLVLMFKMHSLLRPGGLFVIADRLKIALDALEPLYRPVYERLESLTPVKSGLSYADYQARVAGKEDDPAKLPEMIDLMREVGFQTAVLHLHFDRAVIGGIKA
jgi:ubiquinone/menaquinone biosynthesis C-methylase UbiE